MALLRIRTSELRSKYHMTQEALAERAHLSKTTISNLESGYQTKIALDTVAKLCKALNCTPSDLFDLGSNGPEKILKQQKDALAPFIHAVEYNKIFDPATLDSDLAIITLEKKKRQKS